MNEWKNVRTNQLREQLSARRQKQFLRFTFLPSKDVKSIDYFPRSLTSELKLLSQNCFEYVPWADGRDGCDIAIFTAHGSDNCAELLQIRSLNENMLIAVWFWDNHIAQFYNLKTALMADLAFVSHNYNGAYLANPMSALARHVPACSAQWTRDEASKLFNSAGNGRRSDKLLVNYVAYDFSWRTPLLTKLKNEFPEAEVLLMPNNDRSRYFKKTAEERFQEWLGYKASLLLPVDYDLSTRIFDALLAGQVVLAAPMIPDLDLVIPPDTQKRLGILRLPDLELATIRKFTEQAITMFDEGGYQASRARHEFILGNHMLFHRIETILEFIRAAVKGHIAPIFAANEQMQPGIYFRGATNNQ